MYPNGIPKVQDCISYIESCGWKLVGQRRMCYVFENPKANFLHRQMVFTLRELRYAFRYGW